MSPFVISLETRCNDVRQQERVGSFLPFSSVKIAIARERRARAFDELEASLCQLERDCGRSRSCVELDPYTRALRNQLKIARRRLGDATSVADEERFWGAAFGLARRLGDLLAEPVTVRRAG